jgi:GT2 family glycosyltransferase
MYSEELDWCRRIQAAGWKVAYVPSAVVVHLQGKSSERAVAAETQIRFQRSKLRYFRKYHGSLAAGLLRAFLMLNYAQQIAVESAKLVLGQKPDLRRKRIAEYLEVLNSRL